LSAIGNVVALGYVATPAKQLNIRPDVQTAFGYWQDVVDVSLVGPVVALRLHAQRIAIAATLLVSLHNLYYINHVSDALGSLDVLSVSICSPSVGLCLLAIPMSLLPALKRTILPSCVFFNPDGVVALSAFNVTRSPSFLLLQRPRCLPFSPFYVRLLSPGLLLGLLP
jgi:hypothetical protein